MLPTWIKSLIDETSDHARLKYGTLGHCRLRTMGYAGSEPENIRRDPTGIIRGFIRIMCALGGEAIAYMRDELVSLTLHCLLRVGVNAHSVKIENRGVNKSIFFS